MKTSILLLCFVAILTFGRIPTIHSLPLVRFGSYLVSIQWLKGGHLCGGSIVNKRWILTAAHCIDDGKIRTESNQLRILAGTSNLNRGGVHYYVEKIILHPDFELQMSVMKQLNSIKYDIALLKVDQDIKFNNFISSIPLASSETPTNAIVISGGWGDGTNPDLQFLELYMVPRDVCMDYFPNTKLFNYNICTQSAILGGSMNAGDSGGPLLYNGEIVGVLSWVRLYPDIPGFAVFGYSKITSFKDWINEKIDNEL